MASNDPTSTDDGTSDDTFYDTLKDACYQSADVVGDITGAIYGHGGTIVTGDPLKGSAIGAFIGDYVSSHWDDVCDLPENIQAAWTPDSPGECPDPAPAPFSSETSSDD